MNQPNQLGPFLIVTLVAVGFVFFWCCLLIVIGRVSGWILLAQKYRTDAPFGGPRWHFQQAQMRWQCNYGFILTVGANPTGLFLKPLVFFRPGHPPLFVPWSETQIEMKRYSFWAGTNMEVHFPNVPGTFIRFPENLAKRIAAVSVAPSR
jgi:hypothetical protein